MKPVNTRRKKMTPETAYEVRGQEGYVLFLLKQNQADLSNLYATGIVACHTTHETDNVGQNMYMSTFMSYPLMDNPLSAQPEPETVAEVFNAESPVQLVFTDCINVTTGKPERCDTAEVIDVRADSPRCEMCDTWVATQFVNSYAVCDKPRCQDQAAVLPNLGQPRTA